MTTNKKTAETHDQDLAELKITMKYVQGDVSETKADVKELRDLISTGMVAMEARLNSRIDAIDQRTRNTPLVERVVFGLVGLVLVAVGTALVALVVVRGGA